MSLITPKLNYARIRNTQRKNNKSIHELKDTTNMRYNQQVVDADFNIVPTKNIDLKTNEETENYTNEGTNLLEQTNSSANLDYMNSLLKECKSALNNQRLQSGVKSTGHQRTRTTFIEFSHEHKSKQMNHENSFHNHPTLQTMCGTTQASTLKPDLTTEQESFRVKFDRGSPRNNLSHGGPHNTPTGKSGKLFDQFFKKDDLMRRSMSVEDLRFDKRGDRNFGNTSRDVNNAWGRNSKISETENPLANIKGDFLSSLTGYIEYFEKREENLGKSGKKARDEYFVKGEKRGKQGLQKELEAAQREVKTLRKQIEITQLKMTEIGKINKHLIKELSIVKLREEEQQHRNKSLEKKVSQLNQRKDFYKAKLLQAEELLAIERIDNENNLIALKKVLANNIGNVLDHHNTKQDRSQREEEYIRSILKEGPQSHQKKSKELIGLSAVKGTKYSKENMLQNNRYDLPLNSQAKKKKSKESFIYDNPSTSKKSGVRIVEDERNSFKDESEDLSGSSRRYRDRDDLDERVFKERKQEILQSTGSNKNLSKNQQIKILQEKLAELAGENDIEFEQEIGQKSAMKHKSKFSNNHHQQSYFPLRERENSFVQVPTTQKRYDYYMNIKGREGIENDPSMDETSHFGQTIQETEY